MGEKMYLRITELAEALGVSRATAYNLVQCGQIPSIRLKGHGDRHIVRVPAEALRALAARTCPPAKPAAGGAAAPEDAE
jgi:excisionase family DNA binding protein